MVTKILILGSTGSIGTSACNCIRRFPERFTVTGMAAGSNVNLFVRQVCEFSPSSIYISDHNNVPIIKEQLRDKNIDIYHGFNGLERIAEEADYDIMLNALVGAVGFRPTVAALKRGKRVALANKESLVIGGDYIKKIIGNDRDRLLPVDSEHSAILQCLPSASAPDAIESIILTASGGPFRDLPKSAFTSITPEQALNHPTWSMGKKITIDSSTLMNKGFEVIEAHHFFSLPYSKLRVCIHPQSIIHSMVEFYDGAVLAQLGLPDMELPIQYALSYPERLPIIGKRLNFADIGKLDFYEPDTDKFPCMRLCIEAGETGGTAPTVVNAANEVAVELFLNRRIAFTEIVEIVETALRGHHSQKVDSVEVVEEVDRETRNKIIDMYM